MDPLLSRIEDAGLNASAPPEQRWMDGWLLRLCPGSAKRARCVNAVADGRQPLSQRLQRALDTYRAHGLPPIVRITPFTRPGDLDAVLAGLDWYTFDDTLVMVCDLPANPAWPAEPPAGVSTPSPLDPVAYADLVGTLRGTPPPQRDAHARRMLSAPAVYEGFVLRQGQAVLACGQMVVEDDLVGLYDVHTAAEARGRGLASYLCAWLLARAGDNGARHAYLQVSADNFPALAVYRRLGFREGYRYHYRTPRSDHDVSANSHVDALPSVPLPDLPLSGPEPQGGPVTVR